PSSTPRRPARPWGPSSRNAMTSSSSWTTSRTSPQVPESAGHRGSAGPSPGAGTARGSGGSSPGAGTALIGTLVRFGRELRSSGMAVGSGDLTTYAAALAQLDPSDLADVYWAGRTVLVTRRDDIAIYDRVFRSFFLGASDHFTEVLLMKAGGPTATSAAGLERPPTDTTPEWRRGEAAGHGL